MRLINWFRCLFIKKPNKPNILFAPKLWNNAVLMNKMIKALKEIQNEYIEN